MKRVIKLIKNAFLKPLLRPAFWLYSILRTIIPGYKKMPIVVQDGVAICLSLFLLAWVFVYFMAPKSAQAAWFNDSWAYRKAISFTHNATVSSPTQANFDLDTQDAPEKFQADCGDVRFTDASGKILKYYYSGTDACDNASTDFEVLLPSIINGSNLIYMYYGNPSVVNGTQPSALTEATTSISGSPSAATEEKAPSPVGYWRFDEGTGTTAKDSTSNANNGTLDGPTWQTEDQCISGKCLKFDGSDDSVEITSSSSIPTGSSSRTVSMWIRTNDSSWADDDNSVFEYGNSDTREAFGIDMHTFPNLQIYTWADDALVDTGVASKIGWIFVTVSYDGSTSLKTYINGNLKNTTTLGGSLNTTATNVNIGKSALVNGYFDGFIDEPKIYNYARSDAQVLADFNARGNPEGAAQVLGASNNQPGALSNGLVGYWKADDANTGDAPEFIQSATGNSDTNSVTTSSITTTAGNTLIAAVSWGIFSNCTAATSVTLSDSKSNSGWTAATTVLDPSGSGGDVALRIYYLPNIVSAGGSHTVTATFGADCDYNNITVHEVSGLDTSGSVDQSDSEAIGAVGGTLTAGPITPTLNNSYLFTATQKYFSNCTPAVQSPFTRRQQGGVGNDFETGDYVQTTAASISASWSYAGGGSPCGGEGWVVSFKAQNPSATTVDSSGNSNTGTLNGGTAFAIGKYATGVSLDGTGDYVSVANNSTLNPTNITASAWITSGSATNYKSFLMKTTNDNWTDGYGFYLEDDNLCFFITHWNNNRACATFGTTSTFRLATGTYDGSSIRLYLDGVLVGNSPTTATLTNSSTALFLGRSDGSNPDWTGKVDEIRLYNRALSGAEVSQLYNWAPGPVGYWKMDETTSPSLDSSGNGSSGTWTGNVDDTVGKFGKGTTYDGTGDYIDMGNPTALQNTGALTLSAWLYRNNVNNGDGIISKGAGGNVGYALTAGATGKLIFFCGSGCAGDNALDSAADVTAGVWHYVTAVFVPSTSVTLYIDGVQQATTTTGVPSTLGSSENFVIGVFTPNGDELDGKIDEVKVYNYARTAGQIVEDMNAGHPAPGSPVSTPLGHWRFDRGYGTTAPNDGSQGSALDGTLTNMASPATSTSGWTQDGKFNKALNFDGTQSGGVGDYVAVANNAALDITEDITISAWIKRASSNRFDGILAKTNGTNQWDYDFFIMNTDDTLHFYADGMTPDEVASTRSITDTNWHYVAVTRSGSTVTFYIDGLNAGSGTMAGSFQTGLGLNIGRENDDASEFRGTIDETKLYNLALTADQIKLDMNQGKSQVLGSAGNNSTYDAGGANQEYCVPGDATSCAAPVGRWDFSEATGTTANDSSGNANTGTLTNGPTWVSGKAGNGKALSFDGTDDYVNVGSGSSIVSLGTLGSGEMWIKPTTLSTDFGYFMNGGGFSFYVGSGGSSDNLRFFDGTTACQNTANNIPTGQWSHIAFTYNTTTIKLYLNGSLIETCAGGDGSISGSGPMTIGGSTTNRYFNGQIDQSRIFNYERTAAQIAWDYNKGAPVAHWRLDECQGTSIKDDSGNSLTGTLTNATPGTCTTSGSWFNGVSGKRNYSLDFDGNDDFISLTDNALYNLDPSKNYSWSFWMNPDTFPEFGEVFTPQQDSDTNFEIMVHTTSDATYGPVTAGVSVEWAEDYNNDKIVLHSNNNVMTAGSWGHVTVTYDGSQATEGNRVKIYVNGVDQTATGDIVDDGDIDGTIINPTAIQIGESPNDTTAEIDGKVDDFRIYNYVLTPTQIKTLYTGGAVNIAPATGAP